MAISRVKTWSSGEVLTASDLNAEFNNILNNAADLVSPFTKAISLGGFALTLDASAATSFVSSAAASFLFTSGAKTGTPSTTGTIANWSAQTFTDSATAGSGTATSFVSHGFQRPTLAATNASVVTTDAATVYVANAPAAGTNETITNSYALWVDDGRVRLDPSSSVVSAAGATLDAINITAQTATISGSTNITTAAGLNYVSIKTPTYSAASALTITNAASLYVAAAPAGGGAGPATITNAYSIWADSGDARFDDNIQWLSGTSFAATLDHANTAARTYTFPDKSATLAGSDSLGRRGRLKNAAFQVDQRVNSATSRADDVYGIDCWYTLTQTAAITVTQQTLQENGQPYNIRLTQSQVTAQRMGVAQIVEARDSQNDRGAAMTLGARVRISNSQAVRYAILEWTGTADTVTSDVVNDWTSSTYTANNFFLAASVTVTAVGSITPSANTWTDITPLNGTAGSSLNNWIVFVWTEGTAAQNVTLDVGLVQLEPGGVKTPFEYRTFDQDWRDAQRLLPGYQSKSTNEPVCIAQSNSTNQQTAFFQFVVTPRIPPTGVTVSNASSHFQGTDAGGSGKALSSIIFAIASLTGCNLTVAASATPWTGGHIGELLGVSASGQLLFTGAEL